eukprot:TRINITY_DN3004_c0_g2_i5.p1 TRINITY_DN3004_c0_g2~~TRINITY_DN3004_c0_g2_i5.p1  ORF type:complete len:258 (-),score=43.37 TRINITY_DN3004_c0_g2_i5:91-864(-)
MPWFPVLFNIVEGNLKNFIFQESYTDTPVKIKELLELMSDLPRAAWHVNREISRFRLNKNPTLPMDRKIDFPLDPVKCLPTFPANYPKILTNFAMIEEWPTSATFQLVDCPGVYEDDCYDHAPMISKILIRVSVVVPVLNYTMLNAKHDEKIKQDLMGLSKTKRKNLSILVNKFDQMEFDSELDERWVTDWVKGRIGTWLDDNTLDPSVFPVSARDAVYANSVPRFFSTNPDGAITKSKDPNVKGFLSQAFGFVPQP